MCAILPLTKGNISFKTGARFIGVRYWNAHNWCVSANGYVIMSYMTVWTRLMLREHRQTRVSSTNEQTNNVIPCNVPVHILVWFHITSVTPSLYNMRCILSIERRFPQYTDFPNKTSNIFSVGTIGWQHVNNPWWAIACHSWYGFYFTLIL